jgi:hypothetical protein
MKRRASKIVHFDASQIGPPSVADLQRMERANSKPIDTSDIHEVRRMKRHGPIWNAVAEGMRLHALSGHALWKRARQFCPRMPESAVYEFLADKRSVRVEYADAMLQALGVRLKAQHKRRAG